MQGDLTDDERRALRERARTAALEAVQSLGGQAERGAIMERALELAGFSERELSAPSPSARYARLVDHQLSWALTHHRKKGRLVNPRWRVWAVRAAADEPPVASPVLGARLRQLRMMSYREYLRTPEWGETRATALARAEHHCQLNAEHAGPLHVHHNNYERLGEERMADLLVLCETCHARHHEEDGRPRRGAQRRESTPPPSFVALVAPTEPAAARRSLLSRLLSR